MTWTENIEDDRQEDLFFARIAGRFYFPHGDFTSEGGSIYSVPFTYGYITDGGVNKAVAFTAGSSSTGLTAGQWYFDYALKKLFVRLADSGAPASDDYIVFTFHRHYASRDVLWFHDPTDTTTQMVQWLGQLKTPPEYKLRVQPYALGLVPVESTQLVLFNDHDLDYLLYYASFNRTICDAWHLSGPLKTTNFEPIVSMLVGEQIRHSDEDVTFQLIDRSAMFDEQMTATYLAPGSGLSGQVDPKFIGQPLMRFLGSPAPTGGFSDQVPIFEAMNVDYEGDAPTTSNNRQWAAVKDPDGRYSQFSVGGTMKVGGFNKYEPSTPSDVLYFRTGDRVWWNGSGDNYLIVDTVFWSAGVGYLTFTTTPTVSNNDNGNLRFSPIQRVWLVKDGVNAYELYLSRDWNDALVGSSRNIQLTTSAEANVSAATVDPTKDSIWFTAIGHHNVPTLNASSITAADDATYKATFQRGAHILVDFLKDEVGMTADELDEDSFVAANLISDWNLFLPIPFAQGSDIPTFRDVIDMILKSSLFRAFFSPDGLLTLKSYQPYTTSDISLTKEEIQRATYSIDYSEMAKLLLRPSWESQAINRLGFAGGKADLFDPTPAQLKLINSPVVDGLADAESRNSGTYLHQIARSVLFEHLVTWRGVFDYISSDSPLFGDIDSTATPVGFGFKRRLLDLFAERSGLLTVRGPKRLYKQVLSDPITVSRQALVGFDYVEGTDQTSVYETLEISKDNEGVEVVLDDLKAAKDNENEDYWDL